VPWVQEKHDAAGQRRRVVDRWGVCGSQCQRSRGRAAYSHASRRAAAAAVGARFGGAAGIPSFRAVATDERGAGGKDEEEGR